VLVLGAASPLRGDELEVVPGDCDGLRRVLAAAPAGFSGVKGEPAVGRDAVWRGSVAVAGGRDCFVYGGVVPSYACDLYLGDSGTAAQAAYDRAVDVLRRCLPRGWSLRERRDGLGTRTRASAGAGDAAVRVVSGTGSGDAYLVDLWVDAPE
jgi:hypothetical protein